jgi:hypothetical protein
MIRRKDSAKFNYEKEKSIMSIGSIIAIIGGIVTAGCAIAGAIAGIRARKAEERRAEEMRKAEHEARLQRIRDAREARSMMMNPQPMGQTCVQPVQMPATNEVHYYYHNMPGEYGYYTGSQQPQNNYMNQGYVNSGYSYGNQYNDSVYRGEREIGNRSKMQLMQRFFPQQYQQTGYYPQQQYAYAV